MERFLQYTSDEPLHNTMQSNRSNPHVGIHIVVRRRDENGIPDDAHAAFALPSLLFNKEFLFSPFAFVPIVFSNFPFFTIYRSGQRELIISMLKSGSGAGETVD